jgi:predicted ABC-type ATPase
MLKKPTLIIISGPNGSGKTSITSKMLKHEWVQECVYINPDEIAKNTFGDWNDLNAVLNAAKLSEKMREECLKNNDSLIFETVLSVDDKIDFIKRAKSKGYFIRLFFVGTKSPLINASRIALRVMEGGHDVPITKIISRYSKSIANCSVCINFVDRAYIYDNSLENIDATLLFRTKDGAILKKYVEINEWALPIFESIKK